MLSEALADLLKYLVGVASPSVFLSTKPSRAKEAQVSPDPRTRVSLTCVSSAFPSHGGADTARADIVRGIRSQPRGERGCQAARCCCSHEAMVPHIHQALSADGSVWY